MRASLAAVVVVVGCSGPSSPPKEAAGKPPAPPVAEQPVLPGSAAAPTPPALRLPGDVKPLRMALDLTIIPTEHTLTGKVHVDAEVVRATRVVWMNATGLTVHSAQVGDQAATIVTGGDDYVGLVVARELAPGPIAIDLDYQGAIDHERSQGVYAEAEGDATYAYTFFEPVDARRAFPCFDEPSYKIPWQLSFNIPAGQVALANAPVARETATDGGMTRVELEESLPMPSYLVAFVVGPFEIVDGGTGGRAATPIRFVIPKGRAAELRYAKKVTPKVVAALEDYFAMDYPYRKLDVAVVPRYWGTMEHPGLVAMGQPLTLIKPDQETEQRRQSYANILSHELAHYWFGDYVTMAWWDDTWLNEALGQWLDMTITDAVEPSFRYPEERVGMAEWGMSADELTVARAIRQPVDTAEGIQASFDNGITYAKGSAVMRMFEAWVGADKWRGFIRTYIRKFAWGNATADDFLGTMSDELGAATADAFRTFLDQPGVPLISHQIDCTGAPRLKLQQRRALPEGAVDDGRHLWKLPVCARWRSGKQTGEACGLLDAADGELALPACPTEVMMNSDARGYYRAGYSAAEARALLAKPKGKKKGWLSSVERRTVVNDVSASVARAEIAVDEALALVAVLTADRDERVARAGLGLAWLIDRGAIDDDLYARDRRFVVKVLGPLARRLGWKRGGKDSEERHGLRLRLVPWVARAGDRKLAAEATRLARKYLADRKSVADDIAGSALHVAVADGDAALFDDVLAAARASKEHREQQRLLGALGGFHDPALATRALELVTSGEFDLRDAQGIVYSLLYGRETRDLTWAWIKDHLDGLLSGMREDEAAGALAGVAGAFCDAEHRAEVAAVIEPRAARIAGAGNFVAQALEGVDQCIAQHARRLPGVTAFLSGY